MDPFRPRPALVLMKQSYMLQDADASVHGLLFIAWHTLLVRAENADHIHMQIEAYFMILNGLWHRTQLFRLDGGKASCSLTALSSSKINVAYLHSKLIQQSVS